MMLVLSLTFQLFPFFHRIKLIILKRAHMTFYNLDPDVFTNLVLQNCSQGPSNSGFLWFLKYTMIFIISGTSNSGLPPPRLLFPLNYVPGWPFLISYSKLVFALLFQGILFLSFIAVTTIFMSLFIQLFAQCLLFPVPVSFMRVGAISIFLTSG